MTSNKEAIEEESFIILGTSPGTSLDLKCDGITNGDVKIDQEQLDNAMKEMSDEANMAFKAHFKLGDGPSPSSMMVASTIVSEDKSTEELQKRFGELIDENIILKETLKQNNESMKDQFLLLASCQEDMMKTHVVHKEKFDETRQLVERLRQENKKLKQDLVRLTDSGIQTSLTNGTSGSSGPPSAVEFVTSPDDDTVNKLTAQLELVEKQRRQVISENEKLTWQKESLEHIIDSTSKERDDFKEKLRQLELQLLNKDSEHSLEINRMKSNIQGLQQEVMSTSSLNDVTSEELKRRETVIKQLESKVSSLQTELKTAQLKLLDSESVKLEFSKHKSGVSDTVRIYKEQIQDLNNRIKEIQTTVFQPIRLSVSTEGDPTLSERTTLLYNVKLYDKTLKHLSELLNNIVNGCTESLMETLGLIASLYDYKLDRISADRVKTGLQELKQNVERQHSTSVNYVGQIRGTLSIFEGIFKDYNEILKKDLTRQEPKSPTPPVPANVGALTSALVARGNEIQTLEAELSKLKLQKEEDQVLRAQLEVYKADFEAEREAREKMASDKEHVLVDLRTAQRRNQELVEELENLRKSRVSAGSASSPRRTSTTPASPSATATARQTAVASKTTSATGNMVFKCPKCNSFSSCDYRAMEDHFDFCLDDF